MSFKTSDVTVRMGVRDSAYRLGKLAERLTLGHGPVDSGLGVEIDALAKKMIAALELAGYQDIPPPGTARVENGAATTVLPNTPATASVDGNTFKGVKLTAATDAIASDTQNITLQDRTGVVLKSDSIAARVSGGALQAAYFTSLTDSLAGDGKPLDVTTARNGSNVAGRVRCFVSGNQLRNVYLDNTAALQTGASVPVQNASGLNIEAGAVTVANNAVSSVKLPGTITAFSNGRTHDVSDIDGRKVAVPVVVSEGNYVSQILPVGSAIVRSTDKFRLQDGQGNAGANGVAAHFTTTGSVDYFTVAEYMALVRNGQGAIFAMKWDNTANQVGDVNMTAYVGQAGTFRPLFPKTAMAIKDGATVVGTDGKSYTFAVANGVLTSVTTA